MVNLVGIDYVALGFDFTPTWVEKDYDKAAKTYPDVYLDNSFEDTSLKGFHGIEDAINVTTRARRTGIHCEGHPEGARGSFPPCLC